MPQLNLSPKILILIGFVLVLAGAVIPWLIVLRVIPSTMFLNFFAFTASMVGIFLGMIGGATYVREVRRRNKSQDEENIYQSRSRK